MIGSKLMIAALLLSSVVLSVPSNAVRKSASVRALRNSPYFKDGKIEIPVAQVCEGQLTVKGLDIEQGCVKAVQVAKDINALESTLFCSHGSPNAKFDPASGLCQLMLGNSVQLNEEDVWPSKKCKQTTRCYAPFGAHWNPFTGSCTCAVETYPELKSQLFRFEPNPLKQEIYGPAKYKIKAPTVVQHMDLIKDDFEDVLKTVSRSKLLVDHHFRTVQAAKSYLTHLKSLGQTLVKSLPILRKLSVTKRSTSLTQAAASDVGFPAPIPSYVPPPPTQITQELIQESLLFQPQQVAVVGSVIPDFANGVITFLVQLDGPIPQTLALNATDTLPCDTIGTQPPPYLTLVPKTVKNGTPETTLATCLVIAVNMYEPKYITYWVQKQDGSVFSLLSDNKIHAIDQLDTSQPASVAIRVSLDKNAKRQVEADTIAIKRRQIFSISCENPCPFHHMARITSNDGYCGCMFKTADQNVDLAARAVEQPNQYTATMTAEACTAMACINNGGKPALFNPFTATCWCASPTFVETNENAYSGGM